MGERKQSFISQEELEMQEEYIRKVRQINDEYFEKTGKRKLFVTNTYGCQMNEHDSEKMDFMLMKMGYEPTEEMEESDLIIFNTCAVRENAELKVFGKLGHMKTLKSKNPNLQIMTCGCMMQQKHVVEEIQKTYKHVDAVFGTHNFHKLPQYVYNSFESQKTIVDVWDVEGQVVEGINSIRKFDFKAYVNVTFGCNNFCTYCIVPYTRGRERSRTPKDILDEVRLAASQGAKEVTLLGQNVNSYGKTLEDKYSFAQLIRDVNEIDGIERIRFMTSHPKDLSDDLIYAMRDCDKVCNHLHLPFQSGSSSILRKMNRNYTKEQYLSLVEKIKSEIPEMAFTTDVIVGFPGETEDDFLDTMDVVEKVGYDSAFTFIYSKRTGTPAANMQDQVDEDVKKERLNRLMDKVNDISARINDNYRDKIVEVLVEGCSKNDSSKLMGRTSTHKLVNFEGSKDKIGKIVKVKITDPKTFSLNGIMQE